MKITKSFLLLCLFLVTGSSVNAEPAFKRKQDVIYGRKSGVALTMDVFQPQGTNNGLGVIFVVSGGWFSAKEAINPAFYEPFLKRGYTVFAVVHGSQPKFQIPEIINDMHRSVRFIRHNAAKYKIDPDKIGVTGGSAGGHLSLILGTQGSDGDPKAKDPIDRLSSRIQAVACFFPPTDFLNYGETNHSALGENILAPFKPAFGDVPTEKEAKAKYGKSISPFYHITTNTPPILITHGDADKLVPMQQAEIFLNRAKELGVPTKLIVKKGQAHGWPNWHQDIEQFAEWFDEHLRSR